MPNASFPPGATNVISSRNPFCFRSRGMTSLSRVWVNSGTLLFRCMETLRANMSTSCAQCPLRGGAGNLPVFRWFASLHLFPYLRCAHHTGQGLILGLCSNQQHSRLGKMCKFDHHC